MSVLRTGRGRGGGGGGGCGGAGVRGGGEVQKKLIFRGGGGDFGVFGAPHAPTRGSRGVGKRYTSSYDLDM